MKPQFEGRPLVPETSLLPCTCHANTTYCPRHAPEPPRLDPYVLDPEMTCADYPDVKVMDAERLELALREVLDEDEAVDAVQVVLRAGWRP